MAGMTFAQWGNDLYTGRRSYPIVQSRKRWFSIVAVLALASIVVLLVKGLTLGIDFRGGSEFTVAGASTTDQSPAVTAVQEVLPGEEPRVAVVGGSSVRVQTEQVGGEQESAVVDALADAYDVDASAISTSFVGPTWGAGVSTRALWGTVVFVVAAALFMAAYFRAWRMSVAAIVAMLSDLLISAGVYALIGWEVTPSTVIGFLTILGFSLYDKMVVFDKVRENTTDLLTQTRSTYGERANLAVNQTLVRSINTSVVALLPVAGILFVGALWLGAGTLRDLSLSLFIGISVGAVSSIFLATPLDVALRQKDPKIAVHTSTVLAERERIAAAGGQDAKLAAASSVQLIEYKWDELLEVARPRGPGRRAVAVDEVRHRRRGQARGRGAEAPDGDGLRRRRGHGHSHSTVARRWHRRSSPRRPPPPRAAAPRGTIGHDPADRRERLRRQPRHAGTPRRGPRGHRARSLASRGRRRGGVSSPQPRR
jgi:preprotein translocase subunit SecF